MIGVIRPFTVLGRTPGPDAQVTYNMIPKNISASGDPKIESAIDMLSVNYGERRLIEYRSYNFLGYLAVNRVAQTIYQILV